MEQDQTAELNRQLQELLRKPTSAGYEEQNLLKQLVKEHPQSGLLQALYASVVNRAALKQAGIYFHSAALYKLAHASASIPVVAEGQLVILSETVTVAEDSQLPLIGEQPVSSESVTTDFIADTNEQPPVRAEEAAPAAVEAPEQVTADEHTITELPDEQLLQDEAPTVSDFIEGNKAKDSADTGTSHIKEPESVPDAIKESPETTDDKPEDSVETEDISTVGGAQPDYNTEPSKVAFAEPVITQQPPVAPVAVDEYDEVYEEIVGIEDINFAPVNQPLAVIVAAEQVAGTSVDVIAEENALEQDPATKPIAVLEEQESPETEFTFEKEESEIATSTMQPDEAFTGAQETEEDNENDRFLEATPEEQSAPVSLNVTTDAIEEQEDEAEYNAALADQEDEPAFASRHSFENEPVFAEEEIATDTEYKIGDQQWGIATPEVEANKELTITEPEKPAVEPALAEAIEVITPAEPAAPKVSDMTEKLIIENIAATDYFIFDEAFRDRNPAAAAATATPNQEVTPPPAVVAEQQPADVESNDVSKYHDEKMPYSFMWWLDKTRREHASIYQPYIKSQPAPATPPAASQPDDSLQHQYIESIMHQTPVEGFEADHTQTVNPAARDKEHKIIERFIQEEPQIKPPSSEKLGSENKAKRSAEDQDELITETLARIYADQMLYAKAIATYKKLILKFPEKSTYFAGQITLLQQKIS